jgi:hypothetical protein
LHIDDVEMRCEACNGAGLVERPGGTEAVAWRGHPRPAVVGVASCDACDATGTVRVRVGPAGEITDMGRKPVFDAHPDDQAAARTVVHRLKISSRGEALLAFTGRSDPTRPTDTAA